jgi:predicted porin
MHHALRILAWSALAGCAATASAQSAVTIYGSLDQYLNYMRSSSGTTVRSLEDGALLRSRIGFRGTEDLGGGYAAKFTLEGGFNADNGTQGDSTRLFDRQAWVGLASPFGELRFGRQNGSVFRQGGYIDYTTRTMGSMVNNFGVPSRWDNDISYTTPVLFGGLVVDVHYALSEQSPAAGGNRQSVFQTGADYTVGPFVVGAATVRAKPAKTGPLGKSAFYDHAFFNWNYGQGKVYLTYVRSNNSTSSGTGATLINNGGALLNGTGNGFVAGTDANVDRVYHIWQVSADYRLTEQLRVGGLIGRINDRSSSNDAVGGSLGAYYDLSKRTTLMALWDTIRNKGDQVTGAGFRLAASGAVKTNFTTANDVNGRRINGVQLGVLHRF